MEYGTKVRIGWALISLALAISVFANSKCSFNCEGVYGEYINPLSVLGLVLYISGTLFIFVKKE